MQEIILVVDDDKMNLMFAKQILGQDYRIAMANSGMAALSYLENNVPDLILLDINMPQMDGFETIQKIKQIPGMDGIPVIFLTADRDNATELQCFQEGAVDFVAKPVVADILVSRVRRTLELQNYRKNLEKMVAEQAEVILQKTKRMSEIQDSVIMGMANLIESRDGSTGKHVKNTKAYVTMLAEELQKKGLFAAVLTQEYIQDLCKAAPLHDVGKIKIPDAVLQKPGRLTAEEYEVIKTHTVEGINVIGDILGELEDKRYIQMVHDIVLYHHERWDGKGYPEGLKGEEIPLCARIMAVADVFDALYEDRCYKQGIHPVEKVLEIMLENRATQFDPVVLDTFAGLEAELQKLLE